MKTIEVNGPYNFDLVLDRLSLDPLNVLNKEERMVKVPLQMENQLVVAEVIGIGTTENPVFLIKGIENEIIHAAIKRLKEVFQWDRCLLDIHEHFQQTILKDIFIEHYGTPLVLDFYPYSCLLKCIIHQQLNLSFAHTLTERFVTTFGNEHNGVWFYPPPKKIALLKVDDLKALQFSGRKAEYVIGIANEIVKGNLDFSTFYHKTDEEVMNILIKLRGVGPWTVQNFLIFGLGRQNLFPLADIGLQNALKKHLNLEKKPTKEQMEKWTPTWEPYLSYASLYLWRSIE